MSQVLDISSYREAGETRQVPVERQVLPLEHNQVWTRTAEGWFRYKRCKSKNSFFCAMLATFCHCGHFMHVVWQPFRAMPLAQDMFCTLDAVLCWHLSTYSNQIIQKFSFVQSIRNYTFGVTICDACAANHIVKKKNAFSLRFYKLKVIKNWRWKGLGQRRL